MAWGVAKLSSDTQVSAPSLGWVMLWCMNVWGVWGAVQGKVRALQEGGLLRTCGGL